MKQLKDEIHVYGHSLVFNKKPWDRRRTTPCFACQDRLSGETYSSSELKMAHFHKRCAEAPFQIDHLHRQHQPLTFEYGPALIRSCAFCSRKDSWFWYACSSQSCDLLIDLKCALLTLYHGDEVLHDSHNHPLLFIRNHSNEFETVPCGICGCGLFDSIYVCTTCSFCVHNSCIDDGLADEIRHPCHRFTSLSLDRNEDRTLYSCEICGKESRGFSYSCSSCNLQIHPSCARPSLVVEDKSHPEHQFYLLWKQDPFICNACGTEGKHVSYVCLTRNLQIHKSCTSLPRFLKSVRHRHPLSHNYFLENMKHEKQICRICYDEVNAKNGCYTCLKKDCNYVVHVKCVTADSRYYYEVNSDEVKDLLESEPMNSSITRVIEMNELGVAVKIEHFLHNHELVLEDKIKDGDDHNQQCDGCTESISASYYSCSKCNFLLHKSCAELPRTWDGWLYAYLFTLKSDGVFKCLSCEHQCNGFSYYSEDDYVDLCLRCARISDTFKYSGHESFLFYDHTQQPGNCTGCGRYQQAGLYRSKSGNVALDFRCMTLPEETRYKCDKHVLRLTYRNGSEDPTQNYCDICEEERSDDPNHWFYQCSICDNSAHLVCVLGEYPCFKIGGKYKDKDHEHPLTFVQKLYYYPQCAKCGKRCLDLSLECASCNYIVHWKCISPPTVEVSFEI